LPGCGKEASGVARGILAFVSRYTSAVETGGFAGRQKVLQREQSFFYERGLQTPQPHKFHLRAAGCAFGCALALLLTIVRIFVGFSGKHAAESCAVEENRLLYGTTPIPHLPTLCGTAAASPALTHPGMCAYLIAFSSTSAVHAVPASYGGKVRGKQGLCRDCRQKCCSNALLHS